MQFVATRKEGTTPNVIGVLQMDDEVALHQLGEIEKLVDLRGGKGFGRVSVDFQLTEKGREYARDIWGVM